LRLTPLCRRLIEHGYEVLAIRDYQSRAHAYRGRASRYR
jgi:Trk K+ transport system NAD-binding subunit